MAKTKRATLDRTEEMGQMDLKGTVVPVLDGVRADIDVHTLTASYGEVICNRVHSIRNVLRAPQFLRDAPIHRDTGTVRVVPG